LLRGCLDILLGPLKSSFVSTHRRKRSAQQPQTEPIHPQFCPSAAYPGSPDHVGQARSQSSHACERHQYISDAAFQVLDSEEVDKALLGERRESHSPASHPSSAGSRGKQPFCPRQSGQGYSLPSTPTEHTPSPRLLTATARPAVRRQHQSSFKQAQRTRDCLGFGNAARSAPGGGTFLGQDCFRQLVVRSS